MAFSNAASDISGEMLVSRYRSTATAFAFAVELAGTFMSASTSSTTCSTSSLCTQWSELERFGRAVRVGARAQNPRWSVSI